VTILLVPAARTAILRVSVDLAVATALIVGAIRTERRWARILLVLVAVPATVFAAFGVFVVFLVLRYGPR